MSSAMSRLREWGVMGTRLEGPQNAQNHKSGHLDRDSIWTLIWMGPPPLGGYKNSELGSFHDGAWLYHRSHWEPCQISTPPVTYHHCSCLAWHPHLALHPQTSLVTKIALRDPCSSSFYHISALCVCNLCVTLLASRKVSPNKPGIMERHKGVWVTPFRDTPLIMTIWFIFRSLTPYSELGLWKQGRNRNEAMETPWYKSKVGNHS